MNIWINMSGNSSVADLPPRICFGVCCHSCHGQLGIVFAGTTPYKSVNSRSHPVFFICMLHVVITMHCSCFVTIGIMPRDVCQVFVIFTGALKYGYKVNTILIVTTIIFPINSVLCFYALPRQKALCAWTTHSWYSPQPGSQVTAWHLLLWQDLVSMQSESPVHSTKIRNTLLTPDKDIKSTFCQSGQAYC